MFWTGGYSNAAYRNGGEMISRCPVCCGEQFRIAEVLWPELVEAWQLSHRETVYVNRQQGLCCSRCGNNLRSMALAQAIVASFGFAGCLEQFIRAKETAQLRILEINPAGMLTQFLQQLPLHRLISYPEFDMTNLNIESGSYDLVVHSDTLEHIEYPEVGLTECMRVLQPDGRCIFTVPIIVSRLTRSREGLPKSYHGVRGEKTDDLLVHTEFGSDAWTYVLKSGFSACTIHCLEYPGGLAIEAKKAL
jgi:SAM-dependent methyltransferase